MYLYIKERVFTWGDKFDVCDQDGTPRYFVEGEVFSWGKKLHIYDAHNQEVAFIQQKLMTFLPCYCIYRNGAEVAKIRKEFTFFRPTYTVEGPNWEVRGHFWEHDYQVTKQGRPIVTIEKEWMTWGDSYMLDIADPADAVMALATVITIDCMVEQQNDN